MGKGLGKAFEELMLEQRPCGFGEVGGLSKRWNTQWEDREVRKSLVCLKTRIKASKHRFHQML